MGETLNKKDIKKQIERQQASGILKAVKKEGKIKLYTLLELMFLLDHIKKEFHIEVSVVSGALLKTIDTERLAKETINNIKTQIGNNTP